MFELQARDWRSGRMVDKDTLAAQWALLHRLGARHVALYPDDFLAGEPPLVTVRDILSVRASLAGGKVDGLETPPALAPTKPAAASAPTAPGAARCFEPRILRFRRGAQLLNFVFYYPFLAAYVWMAGGIAHALVFERGRHRRIDPLPLLLERPLVSVIVPCFNEGERVQEVIEQLMRSHYPNYEVIAVNDGSRDDTGAILDALAARYGQLRVVHHATNQGKAVALNTAAVLANGEYILGVDGDALVDPDALAWMLTALAAIRTRRAPSPATRASAARTTAARAHAGGRVLVHHRPHQAHAAAGRAAASRSRGVLSMFRRRRAARRELLESRTC